MNTKYNRFGLVRENHVLREKGSYPLMQRVARGAVPDGDGWTTVWEEEQWNGKSNPLELTARVRVAKKQAAARMLRQVETADNRHVWLVNTAAEEGDEDQYFYQGRNEAEVRPASAVQGVRGTNFDRGGIYSGGTKAVREAIKARKAYDAIPKQTAEDMRLQKIADLERRVRELMGLMKK